MLNSAHNYVTPVTWPQRPPPSRTLMSAPTPCTTKCVYGLIYMITTLDIAVKVGLATDIATSIGPREHTKTIINVFDDTISPASLAFKQ